MIDFVHGCLDSKQPARVVLDVGGVGYEVFITLNSFDALPGVGETCRLLTYHHVREDTQQLFGFVAEAERKAFVLLIGVTGIGPRLALSILSGLSVRDLHASIAAGDFKRLGKVHGVGRKTAERMVLELRDRIDPVEAMVASGGNQPDAADAVMLRDALLALESLGFPPDRGRAMLQKAIEQGADKLDVEVLIKAALATR